MRRQAALQFAERAVHFGQQLGPRFLGRRHLRADVGLATGGRHHGVLPQQAIGVQGVEHALEGLPFAPAIDRQAHHHRDQPGLRRHDAGQRLAVKPQIGFLHHILGFGRHAEHTLRDAEQALALGDEQFGLGFVTHGRSSGCRATSLQTFEAAVS